jgi:hypothetical protein
MGALFVVGFHPFVDDLTDFIEGGEHVRIKDLAAVRRASSSFGLA